jgi:hypothetical protein
MTFVGRILVVIHLVLSVFFMAFAAAVYTTHSNWMKKYTTAQKAADDAKNKLTGVTAEAEAQKTADKLKLQELDAKVKELSGEITNYKQTIATQEAEIKQNRNLLDAEREVARLSTDDAKERTTESMLVRSKSSELYQSRNEVFAELKKAEDRLFAMELQRIQFEEKYNQVLRDNAAYIRFLASKGLTTDPKQMATTTQPPTDVEGIVLDYHKSEKGSNELVEISIGSDDDLRIGHMLTVYGPDGYLGQIRLQKVTPDRSVGLVVKKMKNTTIKRGDNVTTKL